MSRLTIEEWSSPPAERILREHIHHDILMLWIAASMAQWPEADRDRCIANLRTRLLEVVPLPAPVTVEERERATTFYAGLVDDVLELLKIREAQQRAAATRDVSTIEPEGEKR